MLRRLALSIFALLFLASVSRAADTGLKANDLIAICGDSITEQKQYSVFMEDYLLMCQPAGDLKTCQFGWSGETSWGFAARMNNDVGWFHPTAATTAYGMNDGGYSPMTPDKAKRYHDAQSDIVKKFKKMGVRNIVVGSPGCVDTDYFKKSPEQAAMYNKTLAGLRDIARQVADEEGVTFANVYDAMYEAMGKAKAKHGNTYVFAGNDGFHPGNNGHLAMAYAFLKGLGCSGEIGTIQVNLSSNEASASEGHKVLSSKSGAVEIESSRYPFCFYGDEKGQTTRSVIDFLPFNEDLNRFKLVVKGATSDQVKVTWGNSEKTFSKGDLEKGINLAAEFLDNPFSLQFAKVHTAVQAKQNYETPFAKVLIHTMWEMAPTEKDGIEKVTMAANKKREALLENVRAAIMPVRHTIRIEGK
jgi:lysophospholipase L1-like esterase